MMLEKNLNSRRWIYLFLGTFALLFTGVIYAWSILKAPLVEEFGWNSAELAMNYTLTMIFVAVGNLSAGVLYRKIHFRFLLICSGVMISLGFFLSSFLSGKSILALYFSYALLCGTGIGAFLVTTISTVGDWFPDLKGICSSTMQLGFGFGALFLGFLSSHLINMPGFGWRKTYLLLSFLIGSVILVVSLLLKKAPKDFQLSLSSSIVNNIAKENSEVLDIPSQKMIKRKGFWQYFMFCMLVSSVGATMISFITDFFLFIGSTKDIAVLMVGVVSVSNGIGRFCGGAIFDKTGRRTIMYITAVVAIASTFFLLLSTLTDSIIAGAIGSCLAGISYGCIPSAAGSIIRDSYGSTNFASNFSISLTSGMPSAFMAVIAGKILTNSQSYSMIFAMLLLLSLMSLVFCVCMKKP